MAMAYTYPQFKYIKPRDFSQEAHHPVVIVGAGLVGLTLALDLAQQGVRSIILDEDDTVSEGSRAIVFAKRSLEIFDRLGLGEKLLKKGVGWGVGRVFYENHQLFKYNYLTEKGHEYPPFLNLQQYYIEEWLIDACIASGQVEIRWLNRAVGMESHADQVSLNIDTPDGTYRLSTDWLLACDGAHSSIRTEMGLTYMGKDYPGRFLIADVVMKSDLPAERKFWFNPSFHPGQSVLLHKQPDNVWRVDFQLDMDVDLNEEKKPENVLPRLREMFGSNIEFQLDWVSVYSFRCRRLPRFVYDRVVFVGDSAHQVSPFGGRGGNGGIQDADNLAWKLAAVLQRSAPVSLIESYNEERVLAADENILNSSRSAEFITPETESAGLLREAVLKLSENCGFARDFVNSGRLSMPSVLKGCTRIQAQSDSGPGLVPAGSPALDAPVEIDGRSDWLLHHLGRGCFTLLCFGALDSIPDQAFSLVRQSDIPINLVIVSPEPSPQIEGVSVLWDTEGLASIRYGMPPGSMLLLRPDQHIVAAYASFAEASIMRWLKVAQGHPSPTHVPTQDKPQSRLALSTQLKDPDAFFSMMVRAHEGLDEPNARLFDSQLHMLLANHIGDIHVIEEAVALALTNVSAGEGVELEQYA